MKITKRHTNPTAYFVEIGGRQFWFTFEPIKNTISGKPRRLVKVIYKSGKGGKLWGRSYVIALNYESESEAAQQLAQTIAEELKAKERGAASVMGWIKANPENKKDVIIYQYLKEKDEYIITTTADPLLGDALKVYNMKSEQVKDAESLAKIYTAQVLAIYEQDNCIFLQVYYKD